MEEWRNGWDQGRSGSRDNWIRVGVDQGGSQWEEWIKGGVDQGRSGSRDNWIRVGVDQGRSQWRNGSREEWIKGQLD